MVADESLSASEALGAGSLATAPRWRSLIGA